MSYFNFDTSRLLSIQPFLFVTTSSSIVLLYVEKKSSKIVYFIVSVEHDRDLSTVPFGYPSSLPINNFIFLKFKLNCRLCRSGLMNRNYSILK